MQVRVRLRDLENPLERARLAELQNEGSAEGARSELRGTSGLPPYNFGTGIGLLTSL